MDLGRGGLMTMLVGGFVFSLLKLFIVFRYIMVLCVFIEWGWGLSLLLRMMWVRYRMEI